MLLKKYKLITLLIIISSHNTLSSKELSISPETFGQRENILSISLSPNGKRLASLRSFRGKISLITRSLDPAEKDMFFITTFEQGEFKDVHWLNNERLLFGLKFPAKRYSSKSIESRLIAMDWNKENLINLVDKQKRGRRWESAKFVSQVQDKVVSYLPNDPDHILLELDNTDINFPDVFKVNVHDGSRTRVVKTRAKVVDWYADKEGVVRLGHGKYKLNDRIIFRESVEDPWQTIAKYNIFDEIKPFTFYDFSTDPNLIYVTKLNDKGTNVYYLYNTKNQQFLNITEKEDVVVTSLELDENGEIRSYGYLEEGKYQVFNNKLWKGLTKMLKNNFPDQDAEVVNYSQDKKKFIIGVTSPTNPGDFYLLDLSTQKLDWFAETYPGLDINKLSTMIPVTYKARDGLNISAYLSLPKIVKEQQNLPTIILPHGGPFARDNYQFDYWVQFLTTRGYAVLQMNFRGSTGYGKNFENLGNNEWGGKMLDDINDGAFWMIKQGYSNPDRICIMGGSYGGYAALQNLIKERDLYQCSIAFAPITNMSTFYNQLRKLMNVFDRYLPYIESKGNTLSEISPYQNVDKINVPVLVIHGTEDRQVHYKQGEMFAERMKKKKKNIKFISLEDGDHYLSREKNRVIFLEEVESFLSKYL